MDDGPDVPAPRLRTQAGASPEAGLRCATLPGFDVLLGRLMEQRGLAPADLAERAGITEFDLRSVLAGIVPKDGLIRRLAPALSLHPADLFVLAWQDVPEDLTPLDHRASGHLPTLAGYAS